MKDTTTTIDDEIDQIYSMIRNSLRLQSPSIREAEIIRTKSRIREIIKDKARSYVLEVIGEDEVQEWDSDYTMCKHCEFQLMDDTQDCICIQRNKLRAEQRAKLDQTLKAIDSELYIGIDFAIGGQE